MVHQSDRSGRCVNVRPFALDDARVADPRRGGILLKPIPMVGEGSTLMTSRHRKGERQRDTACTPSDIDYDIVGFDIRSDDRQVWIKRSEWIGLHERMVGGATSALISRRLRTAQTRALREHGIDPSGIVVSRVSPLVVLNGSSRLIPLGGIRSRRGSCGTEIGRRSGSPRRRRSRRRSCRAG